jgi:hypothetical protein
MNVYVILASYIMLSLIYSYEDLRHGEISRISMWSGILLLLGSRFGLFGLQEGLYGLAGCAVGFSVYFPVYRLLKGKLGLADVWYAALTGSVFGPVWWYAASICGCGFALAYLGACRRRSIRFIPSLAAGGAAVIPFFLTYGTRR